MTKSLTVEKEYNHPIEKVWRAITNPEAIAKWFIPGDFKPVVGSEYSFANEYTKVRGKIINLEEPVLMVYSWIKEDTEIETIVSWKLKETESGTKLTILHEGIEKYKDHPDLYKRNEEGWNMVLRLVENYLESYEKN